MEEKDHNYKTTFKKNRKLLTYISSTISIAILASIIVHSLTLLYLMKSKRNGPFSLKKKAKFKHSQLKFKTYIAKKNTPPKKEKKILETPLKETKKPKKADYLGVNNHVAKKPQKRMKKKTNLNKKNTSGQKNKKFRNSIFKKNRDRNKDHFHTGTSPKVFKKNNKNNLYAYKSLLNNSKESIYEQIALGYQEYIDDEINIGNSIDLNTQEYRYIGYFTNLRKSIELVWIYPSQAARNGIYGRVSVFFIIKKNGSVKIIKIIKSSGYSILDKSIINAIKLASPFAPLPENFPDKELKVTGSFNYILN